tara:strand:- start:56 stop:739 length:684 start_codon:yes stop_codon:yes gene_type:complete
MFSAEKFGRAFEAEVYRYSLIFGTKITDLTLETLIVMTLEALGLADQTEWEEGGHGAGKDISLEEGKWRLSVKSGTENSKRLSISSFRTESEGLETIDAKVDYFDGAGKNFTHYLVLSREDQAPTKKRSKEQCVRTYRCRLIPADVVCAGGNREWTETHTKKGTFSGWTSNVVDGVKMTVAKKMSSQFWFSIELPALRNRPDVIELFELKIPFKDLRTRRYRMVESE